MTYSSRLFAALFTALALTGCASWVAPMSDQMTDTWQGTRTWGSKVEDQAIERKVYLNVVRSEPSLKDGRLVVVSWNGQVLLAGQVRSDGIKQKAEATARNVRRVLHIHNELQVDKPASVAARMNDGWISTRVKTKLLFGPDLPGRRVKVVTENGVVYLMGLLTREEGDQVAAAARDVYGVQKIVKIFEYIAPANAVR